MQKIIFSMFGKAEEILNEVKTNGENDGVYTRRYITPYRLEDENGRKSDCLAIGICNDEPDSLLTFWKDENGDFHTELYFCLSNTAQVRIYQSMK